MKDSYTIEEFKNIQDIKQNNFYIKCLIIFFIIMITLFLFKFNIRTYNKLAIVKNDDNLYTIVPLEKLYLLENNNKIIINKKEYEYKIIKITNYTNINGIIYVEVYLDIINYINSNNYNYFYILKDDNSIIGTIINSLKGD